MAIWDYDVKKSSESISEPKREWMRPNRPHPLRKRRLFFACAVRGIVRGFDLREPLHAGGMDLSDPVPYRQAVDVFLVLAVAESAFEGDELPLLKGSGESGEIAPGEDAVPFGAGLVIAFIVLPAFLGSNVENDELSVVLGCLCLCILSEAADEDDLVEHGVIAPFLWVCVRWMRYKLARRVCPRDRLPRRLKRIWGRGPQPRLGGGVCTSKRREADHGKESVRPQGGGVLSAAR
jgi:hypothetical protein